MMKERIKAAVEFLKEGKGFKVGPLRLSINTTQELVVSGWSQETYFENLSKKSVKHQLLEIKDIFQEMMSESVELSDFTADKIIVYSLYFDDFGKASILICYERGSHIQWMAPIRDS